MCVSTQRFRRRQILGSWTHGAHTGYARLADTTPYPPPDNHENVCRDVSAIFPLPNKKQYRTKPAKTGQDHATVEKIGP
jgi:hypothetical protein